MSKSVQRIAEQMVPTSSLEPGEYMVAAWDHQAPVASSMAAYRKIPRRPRPAACGRTATLAIGRCRWVVQPMSTSYVRGRVGESPIDAPLVPPMLWFYFLLAAALTCASSLSAASLWTDARTRMSGGSTFFS